MRAKAIKMTVSILRGLLMFGLCFMIIQPLLTRFATSIMEEQDLYDSTIVLLPRHVTLENFTHVFNMTSMPTSMLNSLWTALLSLDTVLVAASLAMGAQSPMKYIDKLIRTWSASGINTPEKAMQEAEKYRARQTASQPEKKMITRETVEDESDQDFYSELMNRKRDAAGGNNR